jgi:hypothetical protein
MAAAPEQTFLSAVLLDGESATRKLPPLRDRPPFIKLVLLGLQHVRVMFVVIVTPGRKWTPRRHSTSGVFNGAANIRSKKVSSYIGVAGFIRRAWLVHDIRGASISWGQ